jgi:hypothetical protein
MSDKGNNLLPFVKPELEAHATTPKNQIPASSHTTPSLGMEKVNSAVLKNSIEGIPLLTNDNYTLWRLQLVNFLNLINVKDLVTSAKGTITDSENKHLKSLFVSKLNASVQANVINAANQDCACLIWLSISNFFASNQLSNKACVFRLFLRSTYTPKDIPGFITSMKSFEAQLVEVGWAHPANLLGHLVMDKFPSNMDNISDMITHSGKDITIDVVMEHLCLHAANQEL